MSRGNCDPKGDVHWHIPGRKRPIAYSTKATSDLIVALSTDNKTIKEVYDSINYDQEARAVLSEYIKRGYGNSVASNFFR